MVGFDKGEEKKYEIHVFPQGASVSQSTSIWDAERNRNLQVPKKDRTWDQANEKSTCLTKALLVYLC